MSTPTVFVPKRLWTPLQVPAADTLIYTSPANQKGTRIHGLIVVNTSSAPVNISVTIGTMAAGNAICWNFTVPADGLPYDLLEGQKTIILNAGDTIRAQAGTASALTLHGFGIEMN